jgi:hypothetical protein
MTLPLPKTSSKLPVNSALDSEIMCNLNFTLHCNKTKRNWVNFLTRFTKYILAFDSHLRLCPKSYMCNFLLGKAAGCVTGILLCVHSVSISFCYKASYANLFGNLFLLELSTFRHV